MSDRESVFTIFVGGVNPLYTITSEDVFSVFGSFGRILSFRALAGRDYMFVTFADDKVSSRIFNQNFRFMGRHVRIAYAKLPCDRSRLTTYNMNLPHDLHGQRIESQHNNQDHQYQYSKSTSNERYERSLLRLQEPTQFATPYGQDYPNYDSNRTMNYSGAFDNERTSYEETRRGNVDLSRRYDDQNGRGSQFVNRVDDRHINRMEGYLDEGSRVQGLNGILPYHVLAAEQDRINDRQSRDFFSRDLEKVNSSPTLPNYPSTSSTSSVSSPATISTQIQESQVEEDILKRLNEVVLENVDDRTKVDNGMERSEIPVASGRSGIFIDESSRLVVRNVDHSCSVERLKQLISPFASVRAIGLHLYFPGEGIIEVETPNQAAVLIEELSGKNINGSKIRLQRY